MPKWTWKRLSWPMQIIVWFFVAYTAFYLIKAGYGKFSDLEGTAANFAAMGLPYWVALATCTTQMVGPVLMAIPQVSFYGAVPVFVVMASASYIGGWDQIAVTTAVLSLIVAILTRPGVLRKQPTITKISI